VVLSLEVGGGTKKDRAYSKLRSLRSWEAREWVFYTSWAGCPPIKEYIFGKVVVEVLLKKGMDS